MTELSVIIAARNEEFLQNTIDNLLANIEADTEIIVVLDGYWPYQPIPVDLRVTVIHHEESIGQRAAVNEAAKLSQAKFIMKIDAHCSIDKGFDRKLMEDCEYDWTVIPRMYNLHAFDWKCHHCGKRVYQGPKPKQCVDCGRGNRIRKKIVWKAKTNPTSDFMRFDNTMKFKYWREYKTRPEAKGDICDLMSSIGACFFMHRERFWDLGGADEGHGSWGQFGTEIACKSWLSGGRHVINKKTWFAHMFRTQGPKFGFPYQHADGARNHAKKYSQKMWKGDNWPLATRKLSWLIDKFAPVPDWEDHNPLKKAIKEIPTAFLEQPWVEVFPIQLDKDGEVLDDVPTKGLVYYTDNRCEERIMCVVREQIKRSNNGYPIVSVSQYPIDFGENIVLPLESSIISMFKQILVGIEAIDTDIVFLVEHDVLYSSSHFEFTPPKKDIYYYNTNSWFVRPKDGKALHFTCQKVSCLCAYRDLLLKHYRTRLKRLETEKFTRRMGFEPGNHPYPRGIDNYKSEDWFSKYPLIDIRHGLNLSGVRFRKDQFRKKPTDWTEAWEVPHWGKTKQRFYSFLRDVYDGRQDAI